MNRYLALIWSDITILLDYIYVLEYLSTFKKKTDRISIACMAAKKTQNIIYFGKSLLSLIYFSASAFNYTSFYSSCNKCNIIQNKITVFTAISNYRSAICWIILIAPHPLNHIISILTYLSCSFPTYHLTILKPVWLPQYPNWAFSRCI